MMHPGIAIIFGKSRNHAHEYSRGPCAPAPAECFCQACVGISAGSASTRIGPASVGTRRLAAIASTYPSRWPRTAPRSPGVSAIDFVTGYPAGRYAGVDRPVDQCCGEGRLGRNAPVLLPGFPRHCSVQHPRSRTWAGREPGRSRRARAARRRSRTPRLGSSRCARPCLNTGAARRLTGCLSSHRRSHRRPGSRLDHRRRQ